jgi:hypothetical protein
MYIFSLLGCYPAPIFKSSQKRVKIFRIAPDDSMHSPQQRAKTYSPPYCPWVASFSLGTVTLIGIKNVTV